MVQSTEGGVNGSRAGQRLEIDMKNDKMRQLAERHPSISPSSGVPKVYCGKCHLATPERNPRCIHCGGRIAKGLRRSREAAIRCSPIDVSHDGAVLALADETARYPSDGDLHRAGVSARPEIGEWPSKDGPETGHRLDRAQRGEDAGGRVSVQTRSRSSVLRSDPWPHR